MTGAVHTTLRVELRSSYSASAAGITVDYESRRRGSPVCALARKLIEAGHDPATLVHVYRGDTLCFRPAPPSRWAALRVKEGDGECVRFVPHRENPVRRAILVAGRPVLSAISPFRVSGVPESASAALAAYPAAGN